MKEYFRLSSLYRALYDQPSNVYEPITYRGGMSVVQLAVKLQMERTGKLGSVGFVQSEVSEEREILLRLLGRRGVRVALHAGTYRCCCKEGSSQEVCCCCCCCCGACRERKRACEGTARDGLRAEKKDGSFASFGLRAPPACPKRKSDKGEKLTGKSGEREYWQKNDI